VLKKLQEIRKKMSHLSRIKVRDRIKVNPFLSMMYFNMSFKIWLKRARRNMRNQDRGHMISAETISDDEDNWSEHTFRIEEVSSDEEEKVPDSAANIDLNCKHPM